jgi:hypothetical protein
MAWYTKSTMTAARKTFATSCQLSRSSFLALRRIGQDGPAVRLTPLSSVTYPSANRKENRHARLKNQPKRHRSADSADQIR